MFHRCKNKEEMKTLFRKIAKRLHPDLGGEGDLMILLQECYEDFIELQDSKDKNHNKEKTNFKENKKEKSKYENKERFKYENVEEDVMCGDFQKLEIIDEILKYAENHKRFNISYINSIEEYLEENGKITSSQYNSLVKVYYSFRMDKSEEKKQEQNK